MSDMVQKSKHFCLKEKNRFRVIGDEGLFIHQQSAEIVAVNGVGAFLAESLKQPTSVETLVQLLQQQYDVTASEAEKDICEFLEQLLEAGLVQEGGS